MLAIALFISVVGSLVTSREVGLAFERHVTSEQASTQVSQLLAIQLDEETALRGYLAAGQKLFLKPYDTAAPKFSPAFRQLVTTVGSSGAPDAMPVVLDLSQTHTLWEKNVAQPLIAHPTSLRMNQRLNLGKVLVDRIRADSAQLTKLFDAQADAQIARARSLLVHAAEFTAALMLLFGLAAIVADNIRSRTIVALERERVIADTLQRVFVSDWQHVPQLQIGTAYLSATREAALGGDLFDVYRIDEHRTLLLVADISGKGLYAAVETAQVKYSIRMLVQEDPDPGSVMQKFNATYPKSAEDSTSFVSVFVGILDRRTGIMRYANAGHGPVYVRRATAVEQLQVTGPLIGVRADATFSSAAISIGADDLLVLATDGLTEARDSSGMMLEDERAMRWIADASQEPQGLADDVVARLGKYAGGRIADDLAMLVVRWAPEAAAPEAPATQVSEAPSAESGPHEAPDEGPTEPEPVPQSL